jgi:hypothetical protein
MALTQERDTPERSGDFAVHPVAANRKIYAGALVALNAGYAAPGSTATGLVAVGRAEETVDNTTGGNGDRSVNVRRGVFRYANSSAADAIARTEIGKTCYIVDDQTVAKTDGTGTRSAAGKVIDVESAGVWVEVR